MFSRLMEKVGARSDPLAAKQHQAVKLQERGGARLGVTLADLTDDQIQAARADPGLAEAERLFGEILNEGAERLSLGQKAITTLQLAILLHRQARLDEAHAAYDQVVRTCRLAPDQTDNITWSLVRALIGLGLLVAHTDCKQSNALFAEARELARRRKDRVAVVLCERAQHRFGS